MQQTSTRLALIAAVAVALAMAAAAIAFNLLLGWKVEHDAVGDIEYALGISDEARGAGRSPNYVELDLSYDIAQTERRWTTEEEKKLAAWFAQHPEEGVVNRVSIDGFTCYAAIMFYTYPVEDQYGGYAEPWNERLGSTLQPGYVMAYIDTTSEGALITAVNVAFAIIAILGALAAAAAGHRAGRRIDEAQDAQKRFYENMSHDLKTPLAAIRGFAEGASQGVIEPGKAARAIGRETQRAANMIDEILGLSRLEAGTVTPKKERVVLGDFVQDCLMPFEGTVRTRNLDVQLDLGSDANVVEADPDLFERALTNVLTNAVRHAATTVAISCDAQRVAIWNDGTVPAAEQIPHLFDRFYAGEGGSTGVGLAIASEIASLHGWRIAARQRDGGLEISFSF